MMKFLIDNLFLFCVRIKFMFCLVRWENVLMMLFGGIMGWFFFMRFVNLVVFIMWFLIFSCGFIMKVFWFRY